MAQPAIKLSGRVVSIADGAPVLFAHVYLPGTTFGTYSDESGRFVLEAQAWGRFELTVSHIEHDLATIELKAVDTPVELGDIALKSRAYQLGEVLVEADKNWGKYFEIFRREFIGATPNAKRCRIVNPLSLNFHYDENNNTLKAWAYETLIIENQALGYRIAYDLVRFEYDTRHGVTLFEGVPSFQPVEPQKSTQQKRLEKKRLAAYRGSVMHFLRSLYHNRLDKEGFVLEEPALLLQSKGEIPVRPEPVLPIREQLLQADEMEPEALLLKFSGKLWVKYTAEWEPRAYVMQSGVHTSRLTEAPRHPSSNLSLLADLVRIYPNGYVYKGSDLMLEGYFAWKKIADMLPLDYGVE